MTTYIRPGKAADMLGVSVDSISRYFDQGALTGIRTPGGQRRIDRESVDAYRGATTLATSHEGQ
jgi:excisionase family DNA binding protein